MRRNYYNKYNATKITIDGHDFDSKKEGKRYQELKLLERAGEIEDLKLQVKFELIPPLREPDTVGKRGGIIKGKTINRAVNYVADFVYKEKGEIVVEDSKGFRTPEYILKKKMFEFKYQPMRIRET